ncbi:MAG: phosphatase PAP2 family protein [Acidimicrobiales bacterium]
MPSDPPAHRDVTSRVLLLVVTWIGVAAVLVGAGELVTHWPAIERFDRHLTSWVVAHRSHALDATMKVITWCGSWVAVVITAGVLLVLVAVRKLPFVVVILATAGWAGEVTAVNFAKTLVDRQRPPQILWLVTAHGGSFPSGHAANATLVFATLGSVWWLLTVSWPVRITGVVVSVLGVLTVGFSRVELGVHWTTDVVAGVFVVAAWLVGIGLLFASHLPLPASHSSPSGGAAERSGHPDALLASPEVIGPDH